MITEYSYDTMKKVIELFQNSKIVTFDIEDAHGLSVIDYTVMEDYEESDRVAISRALRNSLNIRLYVVNLLNRYIEKKSLNKVEKFVASFNAYGVKQCTFDSTHQFNGMPFSQASDIAYMENALEQLDRIILKMGISEQETNLYQRIGSKKNRRYTPVTIQEVAELLRKAIEE